MGEPPLGSGAARPQSLARRLLSVGGIVLLALIGVWALGGVEGSTSTDAAPVPSSSSSSTSAPSPTPTASDVVPPVTFETALPPFGGVALGGGVRGSAMASRDLPAILDAWTVVVRRDDGSLGHHGAVVTFPVKAAPSPDNETVRVGSVDGVVLPRQIVWPIAGQHARVRGDLTTPVLSQIAAATVVVDGRPQVTAPAGSGWSSRVWPGVAASKMRCTPRR